MRLISWTLRSGSEQLSNNSALRQLSHFGVRYHHNSGLCQLSHHADYTKKSSLQFRAPLMFSICILSSSNSPNSGLHQLSHHADHARLAHNHKELSICH
jgi:homogentisate 1,2-dioxygenase